MLPRRVQESQVKYAASLERRLDNVEESEGEDETSRSLAEALGWQDSLLRKMRNEVFDRKCARREIQMNCDDALSFHVL